MLLTSTVTLTSSIFETSLHNIFPNTKVPYHHHHLPSQSARERRGNDCPVYQTNRQQHFAIKILFKNGPTPASFSFIFGLFKQISLQFLQQINVKNVHPVYGARIQTHDLRNVSLFPKPLDQGSRQKLRYLINIFY